MATKTETLAHFEGFNACYEGVASNGNTYSFKTDLINALDWSQGWDSANETIRSERILNGEEVY